MTAQEKAKELIEKFEKMHIKAGGIGINKRQAIECAIIAVNEVLDKDGYCNSFYKNVKKELINHSNGNAMEIVSYLAVGG